MSTERCLLCFSDNTEQVHQDKIHEYWCCQNCALLFVPKKYHLPFVAQKTVYDFHENEIDSQGYIQFLNRLREPLLASLMAPISSSSLSGLDFGCGPGPALVKLLEDDGIKMAKYDPIYYQNKKVLAQKYDVITCTEAIEHFSDPAKELMQLFSLLKPGGILAIMTQFVPDNDEIKTWYYLNDPTHITFYSIATFTWVAKHFRLALSNHKLTVNFHPNGVVIFNLGR